MALKLRSVKSEMWSSGLLSLSYIRFTCHGLDTGAHYIFRVRAVNAAGLSGFSEESEAIEVKAAIGKWPYVPEIKIIAL